MPPGHPEAPLPEPTSDRYPSGWILHL